MSSTELLDRETDTLIPFLQKNGAMVITSEGPGAIIAKSTFSRRALARYLYRVALEVSVAGGNLKYMWAVPGDFEEYPRTGDDRKPRRRKLVVEGKDGSLAVVEDTSPFRSINTPDPSTDGSWLEISNARFVDERFQINRALSEYAFANAILQMLYSPIGVVRGVRVRPGAAAGVWHLEPVGELVQQP